MDAICLPHYLFAVMVMLIAGEGQINPYFLRTGALLLLLLALLRHVSTLLNAMENDQALRRFFFVVAVFALALAIIVPADNLFAMYTGSLRLAVAAFFFLLLIFAVRTAPWSGPAVLHWYLTCAGAGAAWALAYFFVSGEERLSANWANPSLFGAMLVPALLHTLCRSDRWTLRRLLLLALFAGALIFTYSRGLIVSLVLALPALWFRKSDTTAGSRRFSGRGVAAAVIILLLVLHLLTGAARWTTKGDPQSFGRLAIWRATGEIIAAHPWRGVGLSALAEHMPPHKFPSLRDPFLWGQIAREAHNEYLHFAAECGLPALIIALYLLAMLVRLLANAHAAPPGLRPALIAWLLHAGVDNLAHFLPTLLLGAMLLALTLPAAWPTPRPLAYPRPARGMALLVAGVVLILVVPPAVGEAWFCAGRVAEDSGQLAAAAADYSTAIACSPLAGLYRMHAGGISLRQGKETLSLDPSAAAGLFAGCARHFQAAVVLEPNNPLFRAQLARIHLLLGQSGAAEEQLRAALALDPTSVVHCRRLAAISRQQGDTFTAVAALRRAVTLEPLYADGYYDLAQFEANPLWRRMAVATHGAAVRYLRHLIATDTGETSIFRYTLHLQEVPPGDFRALATGAPNPGAGGDSLTLWPTAAE